MHEHDTWNSKSHVSSACLCIKLRGVRNSAGNKFDGGREHNRKEKENKGRNERKERKERKGKERKGREGEREEDWLLSLHFYSVRQTKE